MLGSDIVAAAIGGNCEALEPAQGRRGMRLEDQTNRMPVDSDTVMSRPAQWKGASEANICEASSAYGGRLSASASANGNDVIGCFTLSRSRLDTLNGGFFFVLVLCVVEVVYGQKLCYGRLLDLHTVQLGKDQVISTLPMQSNTSSSTGSQ